MFAQDVAGTMKQFFSCLGHYHPPRCTDKESCPKFQLKLPNLHADGRLRYMYPQRPCSKSARFSYGYEGPQLPNLHPKPPTIKLGYRNNKIF